VSSQPATSTLADSRRGRGPSASIVCIARAVEWGADVSSDMLRRSARCTKCGKGATLQIPGWGGLQMPVREWPRS
jgi:hypothetical protein